MKIAHISDLHINGSAAHNTFIEQQIERIRAANVDHLIITGDLTQSAQSFEFEIVLRILGRFGFDTSERLTVIPGNHDLFGFFFQHFHSPRDFYRKLHKIPAAALNFLSYQIDHYEEALTRFNSYFQHAFANSMTDEDSDTCGYPFIKLLGENLALIGLESNSLQPHLAQNIICSRGYVDTASLRRIMSHKSLRNRRKIALIHHQLWPEGDIERRQGKVFASTMRLMNRQEIIDLLEENGTDFILHGHYHFHEQYNLPGSTFEVINNGDNKVWSLIEFSENKWTIHSKY